jgi:hypothetical protein
MTETETTSIFEITNIAELNSLSLYEYGDSINNYFDERKNSNFYQRYFKWFNNSNFEKSNTSFLKDYNKSFQEFFF